VFDTCSDYREAKAKLSEEPLCLPAFFILSGTRPDEGCVIERIEDRAFVHESPICITNHWLTPGIGGHPRTPDSPERRAALEPELERPAEGFSWLKPPVLNPFTRVAAVANAATGHLRVQGFEASGPATAPLAL
jgi:hypothetical protein